MNKIVTGDILGFVSDALVCSANQNLNLSGGVGGAFLMKHGKEMQIYLHNHLKANKLKIAPQGSVVSAPPCGSNYKIVFHAVAVNGFYESTPEIIESILSNIFQQCSDRSIHSIILPALGCGYGNMEISQFYQAYLSVTNKFSHLNITLCLKNEENLEQLSV